MNKSILVCIVFLLIFSEISFSQCIEMVTFEEVRKSRKDHEKNMLIVQKQSDIANAKYHKVVSEYLRCDNQKWRSSDLAQKLMGNLFSWNDQIETLDDEMISKINILHTRITETEDSRLIMQNRGLAEEWYVIAYCDYEVYGKNYLEKKRIRNNFINQVIDLYLQFKDGCTKPPEPNVIIRAFSSGGKLLGEIWNEFNT